MDMSTQLRLITRADVPSRPLRGRTNSSRRPTTRRTVHWEGRWRLDDQTRQVGRAGIASARAALARAHRDDDLRRAS